MYLDVKLSVLKEVPIYERKLSKDLREMAKEVGIYTYLWEPETVGVLKARDLIKPLSDALTRMGTAPEHFKQFEGIHKEGTYNELFFFLRDYLEACKKYPLAKVATWK